MCLFGFRAEHLYLQVLFWKLISTTAVSLTKAVQMAHLQAHDTKILLFFEHFVFKCLYKYLTFTKSLWLKIDYIVSMKEQIINN